MKLFIGSALFGLFSLTLALTACQPPQAADPNVTAPVSAAPVTIDNLGSTTTGSPRPTTSPTATVSPAPSATASATASPVASPSASPESTPTPAPTVTPAPVVSLEPSRTPSPGPAGV